MSQVELLTRAIEKLETLKAESTPGPWLVDPSEPAIWTSGETVFGGTVAYINYDHLTGDHQPEGDAELIVTLHRTIDPILEVLRLGVLYFKGDPSLRLGVIASVDHAVALAHAVLGDDV